MRLLARRSIVALILTLGAVGLFAAGTAVAKKPVKPPPPPPVDSGTIYYLANSVLHSMDPDGSDKAELGAAVTGPPSLSLHGGERWFLEVRELEGNQGYPDDHDSPRRELFAVNEDGTTAVQLTDAPLLQPNPEGNVVARWLTVDDAPDAAVSYLAVEWEEDGDVAAWGIYRLSVDPAKVAAGTHEKAAPVRLPVTVTLKSQTDDSDPENPKTRYWMNTPYDWSPDATSLAYVLSSGGESEIRRADRSGTTWSTSLLLDLGTSFTWSLAWSPDGARIAHYRSGSLYTMGADGTDPALVAAPPDGNRNTWYVLGGAAWSPASTHLVYLRSKFTTKSMLATDRDVIRVDEDSGDDENLTADTKGYCVPLGWR